MKFLFLVLLTGQLCIAENTVAESKNQIVRIFEEIEKNWIALDQTFEELVCINEHICDVINDKNNEINRFTRFLEEMQQQSVALSVGHNTLARQAIMITFLLEKLIEISENDYKELIKEFSLVCSK